MKGLELRFVEGCLGLGIRVHGRPTVQIRGGARGNSKTLNPKPYTLNPSPGTLGAKARQDPESVSTPLN